jgi:spore maturation protein CgeB
VLNVTREGEAECGYSPEARVFEAAGAGACVITDAWDGIEQFFEPGEEILVAANGDDVVDLMRSLTWTQAEKIGQAARQRALWEHTYLQRAQLIETFLDGARLHAAVGMRIHA